MKFLCDQCKAKYQISDDKVAGKTVRMKCRKCGHMIEVRAAVTETSVAGAAAAAERASELPPAPGAPPKPPGKPATLPGRPPLATSLSQAKQAPRPVQRPETGLASAFKSSMQTAKEDEAGLLELSSADEWYAAINGVPVGPVRIAELRRKAALGAVTEDSLVWQEGMEEWRPVKQVPELAALVREAATTRGPSLGTPDPPNVRGSMIPPAPQAPNPSMRPGAQRPSPPRPASDRPAAPAARSNVVPITSRLATAERLEEVSPPQGSPTSERFSLAPDPFNAPAAASATPYRDAAPASVMQPQVILQQPKAPPNFIGIGVILAFMMFGLVAAYAVFFKPQTPQAPPQVIVQQMPAAPSPTGTAAPGDTANNDTAPAASTPSGKIGSTARGTASSAVKDAGVANDLNGLLKGLGGGPSVGGGPSALSGQSLNSDQLSSVVTMHQVAIRRQCVDKASGGASASNEMVAITINGSGQVSSAVATGNDPVTGHCLETEIKRWQFPATGATTNVNLPFHFVRQ